MKTNCFEPIYDLYSTIENNEDPELISLPLNIIEEEKVSSEKNRLRQLIREWKIERKVDTLWLHCTATNQDASVTAIKNYWINNLGWKNPGYHIIIKPDGSFTYLHDFNKISNGVYGHNPTGINVSYIGGIDENKKPLDNRTIAQKEIEGITIEEFRDKIPSIKLRGHNEVTNKACPSYIVKEYYEEYMV